MMRRSIQTNLWISSERRYAATTQCVLEHEIESVNAR